MATMEYFEKVQELNEGKDGFRGPKELKERYEALITIGEMAYGHNGTNTPDSDILSAVMNSIRRKDMREISGRRDFQTIEKLLTPNLKDQNFHSPDGRIHLEEKIDSLCYALLKTGRDKGKNNSKVYSPNDVFLLYRDWKHNFQDHNDSNKTNIKVHMTVLPEMFDELPLLLGYFQKVEEYNTQKFQFKFTDEKETFVNFTDKRFDPQAGKHITLYFNNQELAVDVLETMARYRANIISAMKRECPDKAEVRRQRFYHAAYDPEEAQKRYKRLGIDEICINISEGIGISLRPEIKSNRIEDGILRYGTKKQISTLNEVYPSFLDSVQRIREELKRLL